MSSNYIIYHQAVLMKREKREYYLDIPSNDYKMEYLMTQDKQNFESTDNWLYLGANIKNKKFAKIGITSGNLASRSYSTSNPDYMFCAFKCRYDLSRRELKSIENKILLELGNCFVDDYGTSKRLNHYESKRPSECFDDVDFLNFFVHYIKYFLINIGTVF